MATELRELLSRTDLKPNKEVELVDITDEFYEECSKLELGEVKFMPGFRLNDAMSAVELMDPKMDIGIERYVRTKNIETLTKQGYFSNLTSKEILTIVDATLCCFVSYLEGGNIANTLYTNILLVDPNNVEHPILSCLAHLFTHIVPMVRSILSTAMVYEEEDFNASLPYFVNSDLSIEECLAKVKDQEDILNKEKEENERYISLAISSRLSWLRLFIQYIGLVIAPIKLDDELINGKGFKPKLRPSVEVANRMILRASAFVESSKLGLEMPTDVENADKYAWLPIFEPDYNKLYLTGSFPRKTIIPTRETTMLFLYGLSCRLLRISNECSAQATDFSRLLEFFKVFGLDNSCVLSRCVLQLTMFPHDELLLGEVPLSDLIESSIKSTIRPLVCVEGCEAYKDEECLSVYTDFIDDFTKASLTMIANFGMNLARQRDKLNQCIEEICNTQTLSDHLDKRTIMLTQGKAPEGHPQHPLMGFVFNHMVNLISYHFELSFKLELFAAHEYTQVFWYLGEIICRWHINSLERLQEFIFYEFKEGMSHNASGSNKNKKKTARKTKDEEVMRQKIEVGHTHMVRRYGESALCTAMSKTTLALVKSGKIKVPVWDENSDRVRFEHRMSAFKCLGPPLHLSYDNFLTLSKLNEQNKKDVETLFKEAIEAFELAKTHFQKISRPELAKDVETYMKICKNNVVVLRLISSGRMDTRTPQWEFIEDKIFPMLRLT